MLTQQQSDLFSAERLPRKPYCVDQKGEALKIRTLAHALQFRHVQPNPDCLRFWMVFDVDQPGAADAWKDGNLPPPNIAVINRANGHAHLFYGLEVPLCTSELAHAAPLRFAAAVESAYLKALRADTGYAGLIAKNPLHPDWLTLWLAPALYTLGELSEYVELPKRLPKRAEVTGLGRNCTLFETLRKWAYANVREYRAGDFPAWASAVLAESEQCNSQFAQPLTFGEVKATAKSVAKWVWRHFTPSGIAESDERFKARQAARGRKGGQAKGKPLREMGIYLLQKGASVEQIMQDCGVSRATVFNWKAAIRD